MCRMSDSTIPDAFSDPGSAWLFYPHVLAAAFSRRFSLSFTVGLAPPFQADRNDHRELFIRRSPSTKVWAELRSEQHLQNYGLANLHQLVLRTREVLRVMKGSWMGWQPLSSPFHWLPQRSIVDIVEWAFVCVLNQIKVLLMLLYLHSWSFVCALIFARVFMMPCIDRNLTECSLHSTFYISTANPGQDLGDEDRSLVVANNARCLAFAWPEHMPGLLKLTYHKTW